MPEVKEIQEKIKRKVSFSTRDLSKMTLDYKNKNDQRLKVIVYGKKVEPFLFVVFFREKDGIWECKEYGYHSNLKVMERYLIHKYLITEKEKKEVVDVT